jgi:iron complex transport system substrate-binding protein
MTGAPLPRTLALVACALVLSALLAGGGEAGLGPVSVPPPAHPERIVSIGLHQDELALALAPERVVAIDAFADEPDTSFVAAEAGHVGGRARASAESILSHRPDLVLLPGWVDRELEAAIVEAGVAVHREPVVTSVAEIRASIERLGGLLDAREEASSLLVSFDAGLAALAPPPADPPPVLLLSATGTSPGQGTLFAELVQLAGGRIALERDGILPLSIEALLAIDPAVIFVDAYVADGRARTTGQDGMIPDALRPHLRAVRDGRLHALAPRIANTTSHHVLETLAALHEAIAR